MIETDFEKEMRLMDERINLLVLHSETDDKRIKMRIQHRMKTIHANLFVLTNNPIFR
jgi:phosphatidate phosphatase PAH1